MIELFGALVIGAIFGAAVGHSSTREPSEDEMLYKLVKAAAARKIGAHTRERIEQQIAIASDALAKTES
jgi:hypothetical protein